MVPSCVASFKSYERMCMMPAAYLFSDSITNNNIIDAIQLCLSNLVCVVPFQTIIHSYFVTLYQSYPCDDGDINIKGKINTTRDLSSCELRAVGTDTLF